MPKSGMSVPILGMRTTAKSGTDSRSGRLYFGRLPRLDREAVPRAVALAGSRSLRLTSASETVFREARRDSMSSQNRGFATVRRSSRCSDEGSGLREFTAAFETVQRLAQHRE
jgi:hypothetical protein